MTYTTDILLRQAEQALAEDNLSAMLPYAEKLGSHAASPDVFAFFQKLTRAVLCGSGQHFHLFACCLEAVCAHDPVEGAAFLERMLTMTQGVEKAVSAPAGILH